MIITETLKMRYGMEYYQKRKYLRRQVAITAVRGISDSLHTAVHPLR